MKIKIIPSILILFLLLPLQTLATVYLSSGETVLIQKFANRIWIKEKNIISVDVTGAGVRIKGLKPGRTLLRLNDQEYPVEVMPAGSSRNLNLISKGVEKIVGLTATQGPDGATVAGSLYQLEDLLQLSRYAKLNNIHFILTARFAGDEIKTQLSDHLKQELEKNGLRPTQIIFADTPQVRIGANVKDFHEYENIFGHFGIKVIKDTTAMETAPSIKVQVTIAEVSTAYARTLGIRGMNSITASLLPTENTLEVDSMPVQASLIESTGNGKILASPNLICRSDREAEFWAGGEIPIRVVTTRSHEVTWKKYGILLKVKPKADSAGRMSIHVETEVSNIDQSKAVDGIPAISTNRISTDFDLTKPAIIALSGLIRSDEGNSSSGMPALSQIPILGYLFSSKDFIEKKTELVIFLKPSVINENHEEMGTSQNVHLAKGAQ